LATFGLESIDMHSKYWLIIKDDTKHTFEVCGQASNTDPFNNRTIAMQRARMNVSCVLLPVGTKHSSKSLIKFTGYSPEDGLYERLLREFQNLRDTEIQNETFDADDEL
jgi:hypothetical protein